MENTFEFYEKELQRVINTLEDANIESLENLMETYEHGVEMIEKCQNLLKDAELRLQKISKNGR